MATISFGDFTFAWPPPRLMRGDVEVRLRPQALKAFAVLALHRGQYVGHDRMIAEAWGGNVVSRHTVDVTIGEVRRTLGECGSWIAQRPKVGYCLDVPRSDKQIKRGQLLSNLRTREGLEKALECFIQVAADDPTDVRAFEGQAVCYLRLGTQGMRRPHEMYERFLAAQERAQALGGLTPDLRCDRAFGWHMFEQRFEEARDELLHVIDEDSTLASAYVRLTMVYASLGQLDDALDTVQRGYGVDPLLPMLPATDTCVRFWRREFDEAVAAGARSVELHPFLQLGRAFYAQALEFSGRLDDALAQYEIGAAVSPDLPWLRALHGACLAKSGRLDEAHAMLVKLERLRATEYVDAHGLALLQRALGNHDAAFAELARAMDENSAGLFPLDVDPRLDCFRTDPRFARLRRTYRERQPRRSKPLMSAATAASDAAF